MRSILITSIFLLSCTQTILAKQPIAQSVLKLAPTNNIKINLNIISNTDLINLGNQYLFLFIPFGSIKHSALEENIKRAFFTKLSLSGYNPLFLASDMKASNFPSLFITVNNVQLTAYDLLFTRKLLCKLEMQATLLTSSNGAKKSFTSNVSQHEYKASGFEKQLEHTLDMCIQSSSNEILKNLGLSL